MRCVRRFLGIAGIAAVALATAIITASLVSPGTLFAQTTSNPNAGVAATVQSYFSDIPVMAAIATCESGPRQFAASGAPLYAGTNNMMVGVFQLDSSIHTAPALALGFDITTLAGNLGYARYLYGAEGTEPWISSFPCWNSLMNATPTTPPATGTASALTLDLSLGEINPQVLVLQQLLNKAGFILATSGPGSLGNETNKFGALTYTALRSFQCAQGITCSGEEATTGYGLLNAPTRAALLAATSATTAQASATTTAATSTTTTTPVVVTSSNSDAAENAELQSRVAALIVIVKQLEAELAARL